MNITDAERRIMQAIWDRHPIAASEIVEAIAPGTAWREGTIKALLNRLLNKGAVTATSEGRRYLYSPAISREQCMTTESRHFLERWFDGRLAPLVAHLSNTEQLSRSELDELQQMIEELKDEN